MFQLICRRPNCPYLTYIHVDLNIYSTNGFDQTKQKWQPTDTILRKFSSKHTIYINSTQPKLISQNKLLKWNCNIKNTQWRFSYCLRHHIRKSQIFMHMRGNNMKSTTSARNLLHNLLHMFPYSSSNQCKESFAQPPRTYSNQLHLIIFHWHCCLPQLTISNAQSMQQKVISHPIKSSSSTYRLELQQTPSSSKHHCQSSTNWPPPLYHSPSLISIYKFPSSLFLSLKNR